MNGKEDGAKGDKEKYKFLGVKGTFDNQHAGDGVVTGIVSVSPISPMCECCASVAAQLTLH
jgi:hypothetical protein